MMKKILFLILVIFIGVILFKKIYKQDLDHFDYLIKKSAKLYNVDHDLVKAVIKQESQFDPNARGKHGEVGLMQITIPVVKDWGKEKKRKIVSRGLLFSPEINIEIGTWYLGKALNHWSDHKDQVVFALAQYNAGRKRALAWAKKIRNKNVIDNIPFESTKIYIKKVLEYHSEFAQKSTLENTYRGTTEQKN